MNIEVLSSQAPFRSRATVVLVAAYVLVCLLALAPASASASALTFAELGGFAGQVNSPEQVAFDQASGVAYIGDGNNHRIDRFSESGAFQLAFGLGVVNGSDELQTCTSTCQPGKIINTFEDPGPGVIKASGIAVNEKTHDVYVAEESFARVDEYSASGAFVLMFGSGVDKGPHHPGNVCTEEYIKAGDKCGVGALGTGPGEINDYYTSPLAIDSSGNVWVGDAERVEEFSAGGEYISEVKLTGAGEIGSLAMDGSGNFYVTGTGIKGARKYGHNGTPLYTVDEGGEPTTLTLDGASEDLILGNNNGYREVLGETVPLYNLVEYDAETGAQTEIFGTGEVVGRPGSGNKGVVGHPGEVESIGGRTSIAIGNKRLYTVSTRAGKESVAQMFTLPVPGPLLRANTLSVSKLGGTAASLNAVLYSEGKEAKYHFEYVEDSVFAKDVAEHGAGQGFDHAVSTPEGTLPGDFAEHGISVMLKGLKGETGYHYRLVAVNECKPGKQCALHEEASFTTLAPVIVDSVFAEEVTGGSAVLGASIDPLGAASEYRFEYIAEEAFQANVEAGRDGFTDAVAIPVPDGKLPPSEEDISVSQAVSGLSAGTSYRYRVAAHNIGGERFSATFQLITQPAGAFVPTDGREWELVSPPEKGGADIEPLAQSAQGGAVQAAAGGSAITYLSSAPTEAQPQGSANETQVLSSRGDSGWSSRDIALPHETPTGPSIGVGQEYRFFSEDLSRAVVQPFGAFVPSLSPEASEQTAFLRTDYLDGDVGDFCTNMCYRPLVTGAPGVANVPAGTEFSVNQGTKEPCRTEKCGPIFVGGTPDLSHVVLNSAVALTETETPAEGGLYEWSGGDLAPVSVLPGNTLAPLSAVPELGQGADGNARHAISDDGSRVIWSERSGSGHLYLRDMGLGQTIELDAVQGGSNSGSFAPVYQTASSNGSRVFFTDEKRLTKDAGADTDKPDLYECAISVEEGELKCLLTDLTPAAGTIHDVLGTIAGTSEDGSYVYFIADGPLGAGEESCADRVSVEQPTATCEIYLYHDGVTKLVASVAGDDSPDWAQGSSELESLTARVSPNGQWLAFMSQRSLTSYDNRDAHSGRPDEEVYLYDAAADSGEGKLICASCNPTGARPVGVEYETATTASNMPLAGGSRLWYQKSWLAANIPGWTPYQNGEALYQSRYLSDSGRLFFNSRDGLVAQDTNGAGDVYEYEPAGVGDCTAANARFVDSVDGCIGLISSGTSPEESAFLDASETGGDVFFLTAAKLSPLDAGSTIDVYDAHECSTSSPCVAPPEPAVSACEGESCQAPVQPLAGLTPSSLTFSGAGNIAPQQPRAPVKAKPTLTRAQKLADALKACRKQAKPKRVACERRARRAYGPGQKKKGVKSKKSASGGKGGRR